MLDQLLRRIIQTYCDQQFYYYATISQYLQLCSLYTYTQNPFLSIILYYMSQLTDYIDYYKTLYLKSKQPSILDNIYIEKRLQQLTNMASPSGSKMMDLFGKNEWVLIFYYYHLANEVCNQPTNYNQPITSLESRLILSP